MPKDEYDQVTEGVPFKHVTNQPLWLQCCGCGLVHKITFGNTLNVKMVVDRKETRKARAKMKPRAKKKRG
jgi:uncharacterized Zn finger protein